MGLRTIAAGRQPRAVLLPRGAVVRTIRWRKMRWQFQQPRLPFPRHRGTCRMGCLATPFLDARANHGSAGQTLRVHRSQLTVTEFVAALRGARGRAHICTAIVVCAAISTGDAVIHCHRGDASARHSAAERLRNFERQQAQQYTGELLKDPALYSSWLPASFQRAMYEQMCGLLLSQLQECIKGMNGNTSFIGHRITFSQAVDKLSRGSCLHHQRVAVPDTDLTAIVEALLEDDQVNTLIPDWLERQMYATMLGLMFHVTIDVLDTIEVNWMGHRMRLKNEGQVTVPPFQVKSHLHSESVIDREIVEAAVNEMLKDGSTNHWLVPTLVERRMLINMHFLILMFLEGVLTISNIRILGLHIESQLVKPNVAAMTEKEKLGKLSGGQEQANTISILRQRKEQLEEENARLVALLDERGYGELAVAAAPVTMAAFLASNSAQ